MEKASVLDLKNKILESLAERQTAVETQVLTIPRVESRLAVGYSQKSDGDYQLELRVQSGKGAAYRRALTFKELAKQEANIEVIPRIEIPPKKDISEMSKTQAPLAQNVRPLHIGLSIGHANGGAGTLGAFVSDAKDRECILSNNHVLALMNKAENGDPIYQPGNPDQWPLLAEDQIAKLSNFSIIVTDQTNLVDSAVAVLKKDTEHNSNRIPTGFGFPMEGRIIREVDDPDSVLELLKKDTPVCKIAIGNVVFDNVIQVNWESNSKPFSKPGDSGSLVFTKDGPLAVGLHFAGGERRIESREIGVSYSCNIYAVFKILKASLLD